MVNLGLWEKTSLPKELHVNLKRISNSIQMDWKRCIFSGIVSKGGPSSRFLSIVIVAMNETSYRIVL